MDQNGQKALFLNAISKIGYSITDETVESFFNPIPKINANKTATVRAIHLVLHC